LTKPNYRTELHCHSYYSLLDGLPSPTEIIKNAVSKNIKSIALTDHGFLGGMAEFFLQAKKNNIKPIYGIEFYETSNVLNKDKDNKYYHLLVLCKNNKGMKELNKVIKRSTQEENFYYKPRIEIDWLKPFADDIVVSTACLNGRINKTNKKEKIKFVNYMKSIFKSFYIELQSHDTEDQILCNKELVEISKSTNTPIVITCDAHMLNEEDLELHGRFKSIVTNSKKTPDEIGETYKDCYIQTVDDVYKKMSYLPDDIINEGLNNSNKIANMCNVEMDFYNIKFPDINIPSNYKNIREFIEARVNEGWQEREYYLKPKERQEEAKKRIKYELDVIENKGYLAYFAIVDDFLQYNKNQGYLPPKGRGSAGGSLVAYFMMIHDIDPLDYNLLFERFLNPDPTDAHIPDVDIDIVHTARQDIVNYCIGKYGNSQVCNIGLYSYMKAKTAIKDVGKSLEVPFFITNEISKTLSDDTKLSEYIKEKKHQRWIDKYSKFQIKEMFEIGAKLQGIPKSFGSHPSGKIISNMILEEEMGMSVINGENVCMYDMHYVEDLGFIKFDFLGLKTNTIIYDTLKIIGKDAKFIETARLDFNDDKVYEQFRLGNTSGIFQFSSYGMREVLSKMKVDCIEDLIAANALFRPGAMDYIDAFCHNKQHPEDIKYINDSLKSILGVTYAQLVYQEQMMAVGKMANVPSVDDLRRACGKKKIELMKQQEVYLKDGLKVNGWSQEETDIIWEQMVKFGSYAFNKSHATAYAIIAYITMYLKVYYPIEFMTSLLNAYSNDNQLISKYIAEAQRMGLKIKTPHINKSDKNFKVDNGTILFGLKNLKDCGDVFVTKLIEERNKKYFKNFTDFYNRTKPDKPSVVSLIKAGAFGVKNREQFLLNFIDSLFEKKEYTPVVTLPTRKILKEQWGIEADNKQDRLKYYNAKRKILFDEEQIVKYENHVTELKKKYMCNPEMWEYDVMSMFITQNPLAKYNKYITLFENVDEGKELVLVGIIASIQKKMDKHKKQFAFLDIYQNGDLIEVICWHTQFKNYVNELVRGKVVVILGKKSEGKVVLKEVISLEQWKLRRGIKE
jgi:DNA polymerase-3 subunit alpha